MIQKTQSSSSQIVSDEESKDMKVKFIFNDSTTLSYSFALLEDINPSFFFNHSTHKNDVNETEVIMPTSITSNALIDFIFLYKNGVGEYTITKTDQANRLLLILQTSEFFNQMQFSASLIQGLIIPNLTQEDSFMYLVHAYEKLSNAKKINETCDQCWFELFFHCLETLGKSVNSIIENFPQLLALDDKIVEELLIKCFATLFNNNYILIENNKNDTISSNDINGEHYFDNFNIEHSIEKRYNKDYDGTQYISINDLEKMIEILSRIRKCDGNNIFNLLTNEYMVACSPQSLHELNTRLKSSFELKLPYEIEHYYEEYPMTLKINGKHIIIIVFYKKSEDSLNVNIKLCDNNNAKSSSSMLPNDEQFSYKIMTFLSSVNIDDDDDIQMNVKSISSNKTSVNIFRLNNIKQYFLERTSRGHGDKIENRVNIPFFTIKINLKICYTHSVLSSFLLKTFPKYYNNPEIVKLPRDFLILILKNKYLVKHREDEIVIALLNWLKDEINIKEDINELLDIIQWEKVNEKLIFEFMIKYCHMIYNEDTEMKIVKAIQSKYCSNNKASAEQIIGKLCGDFFTASRLADYTQVYATMMKQSKLNMLPLKSPIDRNHNDKILMKQSVVDYPSNSETNHNNEGSSHIQSSNHNDSHDPLSYKCKDYTHNKDIFSTIDNNKWNDDSRNNKIANNTSSSKIIKKEELLGKLIQSYQVKNTFQRKNKRSEKVNGILQLKSSFNISSNNISKNPRRNPNTKSFNDLHTVNVSTSKSQSRNKIKNNCSHTKSMSHLTIVTKTEPSQLSKKKSIPLMKLTKQIITTTTRNKGTIKPQISNPSTISTHNNHNQNNTINYRSITTSSSTINQKNVYHLFNISTINQHR